MNRREEPMEDPYNTQQNHQGERGEGRHDENHTVGNGNANPSMGPHSDADTSTVLTSLSELAGRSFASKQESVEAILRLIVDQLGLRSGFLARIDREACQLEVISAYNRAGGSEMQSGTVLELPQTF